MTRNYFILGSKYLETINGKVESGSKADDMFAEMLANQVISIGYLWEEDLSKFSENPIKTIKDYLKSQGYNKGIIRNLSIFTSINDGDLIAIKKSGFPKNGKANLTIRAYAQAKKVGGTLFKFVPYPGLGNTINAEFLEQNVEREFELGGYSQGIHKINSKEHPDHIKQIFGEIELKLIKNQISHILETNNKSLQTQYKEQSKNVEIQTRVIESKTIKIDPIHNKIQEEFKNQLVKFHGPSKVEMETNGIDIILTEAPNKITFFEVKSDDTVSTCIENALGQLLRYVWKDKIPVENKKDFITIVVVGNAKPTIDELNQIQFLKSLLRIEFDYKQVQEQRR